jgi:chromosomal replication initiation ATPase DnaA
MNYMTIPGVKRMKADYKTMPKNQVLSYVDAIIGTVCDQFGISMRQIKSSRRKNYIVIPRMLTMYLLREKTMLTLEEVGDIFNRHHSTVIAAVSSSRNMLETDDVIKQEYQKLLMKL